MDTLPVLDIMLAEIGPALNAAGAERGLPPLNWGYRKTPGRFTIVADLTDPQALHGWATALGLDPAVETHPGCAAFVGRRAGVDFALRAIVDPQAYAAAPIPSPFYYDSVPMSRRRPRPGRR